MSDKVEQVLVFPAPRLEPYLDHFEKGAGIVTDPATIEDVLDSVLAPDAMRFMDRPAAERDERFKQVIPYCVLSYGSARGFVFAYERAGKGGESRLHSKWSLGVGGHINPCDGLPTGGVYGAYGSVFPPLYDAALRRELLEEVSLEVGPDLGMEAPAVALIYDSSDEVGRVHFGVVHAVNVRHWAAVKPTDPALAGGEWLTRESMGDIGHRLENWSRLVFDRCGLPC